MKTAFPVVGELTPSGSKAKAGKAAGDSIITADEGVKYSFRDTDYNIGIIKETPFMVEGELTPFGLEAERMKEVSNEIIAQQDDQVNKRQPYRMWENLLVAQRPNRLGLLLLKV